MKSLRTFAGGGGETHLLSSNFYIKPMRKVILVSALLLTLGVSAYARPMSFRTSCGTVTYSDTEFFDSIEEMAEVALALEARDCGTGSEGSLKSTATTSPLAEVASVMEETTSEATYVEEIY